MILCHILLCGNTMVGTTNWKQSSAPGCKKGRDLTLMHEVSVKLTMKKAQLRPCIQEPFIRKNIFTTMKGIISCHICVPLLILSFTGANEISKSGLGAKFWVWPQKLYFFETFLGCWYTSSKWFWFFVCLIRVLVGLLPYWN